MCIFHVESVRNCKINNLHKAKITVILGFLLLWVLLLLFILVAVLLEQHIFSYVWVWKEITSDCANRRVFG